MIETVTVDAETAQRWMRAESDLAHLRRLWARVHDYGGTFTTPKDRLAAGEELRAMLDG